MSKNKFFATLFMIIFILFPVCANAYEEPAVQLVVQNGDSLIELCNKYLENPKQWKKIAEINRLENPDLIYPGQTLLIPANLLKELPADGIVSFIKGNVEYQSDVGTAWKPLHLNDRVKEGFKIRTGDDGIIEIMLEDGISFLQSQNTVIGLSTVRKSGSSQSNYKLFLHTGRTITNIKGATGREPRFYIETPSAICAARGTVFRTSVDASDFTRSEVLEGKVDVEAMNKKVKVGENEGTLVKKGLAPMEPQKLLSPPAPVNLSPMYKNIPLHVDFRKVEGAVSYRIIVARDKDCKDILKEQVIKPTESFTIHTVDDGTYFLQSRSIDNLGLEGIPSDMAFIKVRVNPLPPMIESPVDKAVYKEASLTLRWLKVENAVRYQLEIAEDKEFNKIVTTRADIQDREYHTGKLDFKTYYFRIRSIAKDDYQGEWSDILSFSVSPSQNDQKNIP